MALMFLLDLEIRISGLFVVDFDFFKVFVYKSVLDNGDKSWNKVEKRNFGIFYICSWSVDRILLFLRNEFYFCRFITLCVFVF